MACSVSERKKLIEPSQGNISIKRQCELLCVPRSSFYYEEKPESEKNVLLTRRIDEIYTRKPYYGAVKITRQLNREGHGVNHKRIERLMSEMSIQAIRPKKNTSVPNPEHKTYPYLLRGVTASHPNHIWGTDITYVRAPGSWFYLVAVLDWFSRYVISWKLSPSMSVGFCVEALNEALATATPEIHNSDQGSQFTSKPYLSILEANENIKISMDGRGRCFDNIFTERLWRSVKYEEVYLRDYESYEHATASLKEYFTVYNNERLHQSLDYKPPAEVYFRK